MDFYGIDDLANLRLTHKKRASLSGNPRSRISFSRCEAVPKTGVEPARPNGH